MSDLSWVQEQLAGDPREQINFHDDRAYEELREKGIEASMVTAEKRKTRRGDDMWELRDTVNFRHYLFRDKMAPESDFFFEWHTADLLERLDTLEQGATLHFNPPVRMFVMKSRTNFSHVICPVVD